MSASEEPDRITNLTSIEALREIRSTLGLSFLMICLYCGFSGQAKAANKAGVFSASAKARIYSSVKLGQDGSIKFDFLDRSISMPVTVRECDDETRKEEKKCVLLIYEIQ